MPEGVIERSGAGPPDLAGRTFEVRIHGRGGQGVVTAAELLSVAAFDEGRWAQAFPSFGSERTGAPVVSFVRISGSEIRTREPVVTPDALIVLDATLIHQVDLFSGVAADGYVLLNTAADPDDLGLADLATRLRPERLVTVPATELALRHVGRAVPNAVLLGGFAAMTEMVSLDSVVAAIGERFSPRVAERNAAAAAEAFEYVVAETWERTGAAPD